MPNEVIPDTVHIKTFLVPHETVERAAGFLIFDKVPQKQYKAINGKAK